MAAIGAILLVFFTLVMLFPIFIMVSTSLKTMTEIYQFPPALFPARPVWANYADIFGKLDFLPYFKNSAFVSVLIVIGTLISSSLVAFGFSRYNAPGKDILFTIVLATLMIPFPSLMIPQFVMFSQMKWVDSYLPIIVPAFFGSAYMIFLLRQFFGSLSNSLFEAARIDGCGEFRAYWSIALPLSGPALATVAIFSFIWSWDDLLTHVIYLSTPSKYTLPLLLSSLTAAHMVPPWNEMMVAALLTALPCILLFLFCTLSRVS
jgi:multiple sugar transport system permease protein